MPDLGPWDVPKPCWAGTTTTAGTADGSGLVTYETGPGLQHYLWLHETRLRPGDVPDPNPVEEDEPGQPW